MRLVDLQPRWLSDTRFAFKCPHCQAIWLTCQTAPTGIGEQCNQIEAALGIDAQYVPCGPGTSWEVTSRDFALMTVTPSINAESSGHWHGFIRDGNIV